MDLIDISSVRDSADALRGVLNPTPAFHSPSLSTRLGTTLWIKPEYRQRTGSFKFRGAYWKASGLPTRSHLVAGSAGNHAQGVALAAQRLGHSATIFMPDSASLPKVAATRGYGASVEVGGATVDDAIERARAFAQSRGAVFVPPFDDVRIIEGQATIGLELCAEVPEVDAVLVAVGGGGLCAGVAAAIKATRPEVNVIGVAAEGANSIVASLNAGHPISVVPATVADGIALKAPTELTLAHIDAFTDEIVTVSDDAIAAAMILLLERAKAVVEPAGAAALAALLCEPRLATQFRTIAVVCGGGNVDPLLLSKCIDHGLVALGRFCHLRVLVEDSPGSLAQLCEVLAAQGINVVEVTHVRNSPGIGLRDVQISVLVETRDRDHGLAGVAELRQRGFQVVVVD